VLVAVNEPDRDPRPARHQERVGTDGDVLDDFVVRSNWGIRVIGSDGSDNLV
jgi:hypothetical protein